jgi:hypothetical protein
MNPLSIFIKHLLVFTLCLVLSSCEDRKGQPEAPAKGAVDKASNDADPVGTWTIDSDATLAANQSQISRQLEKIPAANQAEARRKLEDMFRSVEGTMEFKPDNSLATTTVFDGKEMTMQGTWEINEGKISTRANGPNGEQATTGEIQEGNLKLVSSGDQYVVLRRQ